MAKPGIFENTGKTEKAALINSSRSVPITLDYAKLDKLEADPSRGSLELGALA
jgi:hypothetical protein